MGFSIDFDLSIILLFCLVWLGIVIFLRKKKQKSLVYLIFFTIFYIYIVKVLSFTQFPVYIGESMRANIGQHVWANMNLMPFISLTKQTIATSVLNVILMVPFGFGLPFITALRMRQVVLGALITSVCLEILQLFTALGAGFTFRVVDVNDIIFNTLGAAIGYLLFLGFVRAYRRFFSKRALPENPVLKYILERSQV